jgi:hypothetical protein
MNYYAADVLRRNIIGLMSLLLIIGMTGTLWAAEPASPAKVKVSKAKSKISPKQSIAKKIEELLKDTVKDPEYDFYEDFSFEDSSCKLSVTSHVSPKTFIKERYNINAITKYNGGFKSEVQLL